MSYLAKIYHCGYGNTNTTSYHSTWKEAYNQLRNYIIFNSISGVNMKDFERKMSTNKKKKVFRNLYLINTGDYMFELRKVGNDFRW